MRYFITHTTKNYEHVTYQLARSIRKYSRFPLLVFTIDYDASNKLNSICETKKIDLNIPEISSKNFTEDNGNQYVLRNDLNAYYGLTSKVDAMLEACKMNIDEWVYLDSDCIVNESVDDLFNYIGEVGEYPLASLGPYEFVLFTYPDGSVKGNPFWKGDDSCDYEAALEVPMMRFFGLEPNQRGDYRTTNILVGKKQNKNFLEIWRDCKNLFPKILNIGEVIPFQDETIYNVLVWQRDNKGLPMVYINVQGSDVVDHFYKTTVDSDTYINNFYKLPKDKSTIKVFHGEKREDEIEKIFQIIDNNSNKIKVLLLAPHLSTGGMPAYVLKQIEVLKEYSKEIDLYVVEFSNFSDTFTVQRDKIKKLIDPEKYFTLSGIGGKKDHLIDIIKENKIDIVHSHEIMEGYESFNLFPQELLNKIYDNDRTWKIVETCHNMSFNPNEFKVFTPDAFAFCTPWHKLKTFSNYKVLNEVFQYPIENKRPTKQDKLDAKIKLGLNPYKKHILNVGLWTPGKNQKEGLQIAKLFLDTNPEIEFHFVGNYAPNFEDYWKPLFESCPKNVKIWGERNDIETFMIACDMFMFNSTWECNPLVLRDAASYGMRILSRNLPQYLGMFDLYITPIDDDIIKTKELILLRLNLEKPYSLDNNQSQIFAEQFVRFYKEVNNLNIVRQKRENKIKIVQHFVDQPFLEILGNSDKKYLIKFFDESGICHYTNEISSNCWVKLNRCYYTKWNTKIWEDGELIYDETLNYENKRVFISFESKSLGDTLAWIPYVQEFKNKHNCHVVVSTFWNKLFKYSYPELEFTEPGTVVYNLHGLYRLGWFYDKDKEPILPNVIPLQKTATNILGLEYVEIKPTLDFKEKKRPIKEKYVTIANESTSGCKYWNYPNGWQELVDYLISKGYKVINVSKNGDKLKNVEKLSNTSIENTMNFIYHSEFFIGLSSGLSWLSWALGKHVVLISNFTEIDHEFTTNTTRIYNHDVCNSCWNNPLFKFDKGDWNWCPEHKNTDRQFECHKSITTEMVINKIKKFLK